MQKLTKLESENKNSLDYLKTIVNNTNLIDIVKNNLLERIDCLCDYEEFKEDNALIVELDTCLEIYKVLTGQDAIINNQEKDDVELVVKNYFKNTLSKFPFNISTEKSFLSRIPTAPVVISSMFFSFNGSFNDPSCIRKIFSFINFISKFKK